MFKPPPPKYENTFRLGPDGHIHIGKVRSIISFAKNAAKQEAKFDLLKLLDLVRYGLKKEKSLKRFKLVATGFVVDDNGQDVKNTSKCLWASETDFSGKKLTHSIT